MKRRDMLKLSGAAASGWVLLPKLAVADDTATLAANSSGHVPSLPQYDGVAAKLVRKTSLAVKQARYTWTEHAPNLAGVPMSRTVVYDEQPTLEWLLKTSAVLIDVLINVLAWLEAVVAGALSGSVQTSRQQLQQWQTDYAGIKQAYDALSAQYADAAEISAPDVAQAAQLQQSAMRLFAQLGQLGSQLPLLVPKDEAAPPAGGDASLDRYKAMFQTIALPEIAGHIYDDELFAYLRVGGPNPVLIQRIDQLPAKFPLTDAQYRQVMGGSDSLSLAASSGRLYLLDYADLGSLAPAGPTHKLLTGTGYASAPIALFAIPIGGSDLQAVAIQCQQDPSMGPIFLRTSAPDNPGYWAWQLAKTAVQTADFNYHEMFVHLGRTHLVSEAFSVATQRCLSTQHPLNVLLLPHMEGNIYINELAALVIMGPLTFGDIILAAPIKDAQASAGGDRLGFDFYAHMPPNDFKARGVAEGGPLGNYPYRDDALLIWQAIQEWVRAYLALYYANDADVTGDTDLADWSAELIKQGKVKGFTPIATLAQLIEVVTMIIFNASAQHAAVNFPQSQEMAYAPAFAGMTATAAPNQAQGQTEADWDATPPGTLTAIAQLSFLHILGSVYYRPLGDYRGRDFPYPSVFTDPRVTAADGPLAQFRSRLQTVESTIEARNAKRSHVYPYLLPSKIPSSTNV